MAEPMKHHKLREWEKKLKRICDETDSRLEDRYGKMYKLRSNRPERGETQNPEMDGLFNVQAVFTPGYRSKKGRGYLVEVEISTYDNVSALIRQEIRDLVLSVFQERLPQEFPDRTLEIGLDGNMIKIWGDMSLGLL